MFAAENRRWWAIAALALSALAVGADATILNLALPTLATALSASTAQLQWFVASYTLVLAAALLPGGMLGDRYGRKRLLLIALVIFALGSLACAAATTPETFIGARVLLGLGAAIILPLVLGIIPAIFNDEERPKAIALVTAATVLALPIGPILGGWLLTHFRWEYIFLINVPVAALAFVATGVLLPESRSARAPRVDLGGVLASSAGLVALTYGIISAGQHGWGDAGALAALVAGAIILIGFVAWERRVAEPLVDLRLFHSAGYTWGIVLATIVSFTMFGVLFTVPQYFQAILGTDAMGAGLRLLPLIAGVAIGAGLVVRLAKRTGDKIAITLGFALIAAGLAFGSLTSIDSDPLIVLAWTGVTGLGLGFAMPTAMNAALGALSAENSGIGSALMQAIRSVGGSFGVAILGAILNAAYLSRLDLSGLPAAAAGAVRESVFAGQAVAHQLGSAALLTMVERAFVHGMDLMLLVTAALAILGTLLALAFMPRHTSVHDDTRTAGPIEASAPERVESTHERVIQR